MRWLLLKDLQILRRSPLLLATVVLYPVLLALLVGVAFNAGPEQAEGRVPQRGPDGEERGLARRRDASTRRKYAAQIFKSIDPVRVKTRAEARESVESGRTLAALIIPEDITDRL